MKSLSKNGAGLAAPSGAERRTRRCDPPTAADVIDVEDHDLHAERWRTRLSLCRALTLQAVYLRANRGHGVVGGQTVRNDSPLGVDQR